MENRKCSQCKVVQPIVEFYKNKQNKNGYRSECKICTRSNIAKWTKINSDKIKVRRKKHYKEHSEIRRGKDLKRNFGITLKDYDTMWGDQNGLCAICGKPEIATLNGIVKRLAVDHNHQTGKVRALLCRNCNLALGYTKDSITRLFSMIEYLERHD